MSNKEEIQNRISKIKGQLEGIDKMVEQERECLDIIQQIAAVNSALKKVGTELLKDEMSTCTKDKEKLDKLLNTMFKLN